MPSYEFSGLTAMTYPESRDAAGIPLGTVRPGDVRDLDEPPGHWWVPAAPLPRRRKAVPQQDAGQDPAAGSGSDDEAGQPGSKES